MYLGIDIGTSSVKTALLCKTGAIIEGKVTYPEKIYNREEHSVRYIEDTVKRAIRYLLQNNKVDGDRIKGIGVCSHGPSFVFIDEDGTPLTDIINWYDRRSMAEAAQLRAEFSDFNKDATSFSAKIVWFYKKSPHLFSGGNTVLYPKDYIIYRLTESRITDKSTASTVYFYNNSREEWDFNRCNIGNDIFPDAINPWERAGDTGTDFSTECGLPGGIPVIAGGIDAYCETVGAGAIREGQLVDGTGTSTCISKCCSQRENLDRHVLPAKSLVMKTISYTGGSINWIREIFADKIDDLNKLNLTGPVPVIYLPYLIGERSPIWDEKARGAFVGLTAATTSHDIVKSVFQGIGFAVRQNLELLPVEGDDEDTAIRAVGGGALNRDLLKVKAGITNREYLKMRNINSAATGAAILAAYNREGNLETPVARWVKIEEKIIPESRYNEEYNRLYNIYTQLYGNLKASFHRLYDFK